MKKRKILFHINELSKWAMVTANANNFFKGLNKDEEGEVLILANGEAVRICREKASEKETIASLRSMHPDTMVFVCRNSLRALEIEDDDVPFFFSIVPTGIIFINDMQNKSYSYIKP